MACGSCGHARRRSDSRLAGGAPTERRRVDPTLEVFTAAANPRYLVVANQLATDGKRFTSLAAAQDYARKTRGIVRHL